MLAPQHPKSMYPPHTSHHPSILALSTCKTFCNFLAGVVVAALAAACGVPVQELIYECAGTGEWGEHTSREGGRAGWLTAATMLHGTVKEGWFEEGYNPEAMAPSLLDVQVHTT